MAYTLEQAFTELANLKKNGSVTQEALSQRGQ
jgi:hypothetical protein